MSTQPWRDVTGYEVVRDTGRPTITLLLSLECGHKKQISRHRLIIKAKRARCVSCGVETQSLPIGLDFLAEAALTQARMAEKRCLKAAPDQIDRVLADYLATVIDMLEEINAKLKENAR